MTPEQSRSLALQIGEDEFSSKRLVQRIEARGLRLSVCPTTNDWIIIKGIHEVARQA